MINVIPLSRPGVHSHAPTPPQMTDIARHQAIENALSVALYHVRHGNSSDAIRTATAKAIRAASMLKQACESANGGSV